MTKPYTYCITHLPTGRWYYGVRYANGCHPSDLWVNYFTSSRTIWNLIKENGHDSFKVEIRKTFESKEEAISWEARVNRRIVNLEMSLNQASWPAVSKESQEKSKISKRIIGPDGLTSSQRAGLKWKAKKNEIEPETGLTYGELRKMKFNMSFDKKAMSLRSKEWHRNNENPTKNPDVKLKISKTLKEGFANGTIKSTKGKKISKISAALIGNQAVKGMKWFNDGKKDFRLFPNDERCQGLNRGRLLKKDNWNYTKITCPVCGRLGGGGNMKRYHFEKCKFSSQTL